MRTCHKVNHEYGVKIAFDTSHKHTHTISMMYTYICDVSCTRRDLSVNPDNKVRVVQEGGLPHIIALLRSREESIRELAGVCMQYIHTWYF
jgi:hypothetical protein